MSQIFNSKKRTNFFEKSGLPFWDAFYEKANHEKIYYPYALYTSQKEDEKLIREIETATVLVAEVFEKVLKDIKNWTKKDLEDWGFDPRYYDLLQTDWDDFFCFRAGWAFKGKQLKLMEINSQTPSFWFEIESGNKLLAKEFNLKDPNSDSNMFLQMSLNQAILKGIQKLPGLYDKKPKVGFVTCNFYEDLHIMNWLSKFCVFEHEVLHIENLDYSKKDNIPFNRETKTPFDVLIFWYPIEWMLDLKFQNGEKVWPIFIQSLKQKSSFVIHALPAFFIQSKAILAYITKNQDQIFTGHLKSAKKYFAKTYLEETALKDNFIAKPLWGREGRGSFIIKNGQKTYSRYQEDYYSKQKKVYQELLTLPKVQIEDKSINIIYEAWVYRVGEKFVPGGIGTRGSEHLITDDFSYWIPIGI